MRNIFRALPPNFPILNFDSPNSFRGISWDGTTPISGTRILDPLYLSGMAKVIGTYQRYAGVQNDWHVGTITQEEHVWAVGIVPASVGVALLLSSFLVRPHRNGGGPGGPPAR